MTRYFIHLCFKGANYHGWQAQKNAVTVQQTIEQALNIFFREPVPLTGCGRTDTGVHALSYYAHFDSLEIKDACNFLYHINCLLPKDITINGLLAAEPTSHARFDAVSRTYTYRIITYKNPFLTDYAYFYPEPLDLDRMNEAAQILLEYTDFTSFSKLHTDTATNICRIMEAGWTKTEGIYTFTIRADRFLRNMVRAITGTMIDIGRGKTTTEQLRSIIDRRDRCCAGFSVPAQGLALTQVLYPYPVPLPGFNHAMPVI